jgi:anti-sigma factor RsiW
MSVSHPIRLQCREVVARVTDLLDGELAPADLVRLEQHLLVCPPCTLHVAQMRETVAALAAFRRWKAR